MADYSSDIRAGFLELIRDSVEAGTIEILSAANQVLAVFDFDATAGGITGVTWTPDVDVVEVLGEAAAGVGTAANKARFKSAADAIKVDNMTVTLTGGGGNLTLDNLSISENQKVRFTGGTISFGTL